MRSLRANRRQLFWKLELPAALPMLFGGLKLSVTLAVVGAVVAEFVGADAGLGFLINLARGVLDTPLMFVAVITLVVIAEALYLGVVLLENRLLRWERITVGARGGRRRLAVIGKLAGSPPTACPYRAR